MLKLYLTSIETTVNFRLNLDVREIENKPKNLWGDSSIKRT